MRRQLYNKNNLNLVMTQHSKCADFYVHQFGEQWKDYRQDWNMELRLRIDQEIPSSKQKPNQLAASKRIAAYLVNQDQHLYVSESQVKWRRKILLEKKKLQSDTEEFVRNNEYILWYHERWIAQTYHKLKNLLNSSTRCEHLRLNGKAKIVISALSKMFLEVFLTLIKFRALKSCRIYDQGKERVLYGQLDIHFIPQCSMSQQLNQTLQPIKLFALKYQATILNIKLIQGKGDHSPDKSEGQELSFNQLYCKRFSEINELSDDFDKEYGDMTFKCETNKEFKFPTEQS